MEISSYCCNSCALSSISMLSSAGSAVKALHEFCAQELGNAKYGAFCLAAPFYVFVAGPEVKAGQPGSSHHSAQWVKYGTEFAQYILDNDLGEIATTPAKLNLKYHPDTKCQAWIWSPNQENLEKWWKQQQATKKPVKEHKPDAAE